MFTCIDPEKCRSKAMRDDLQEFLSQQLGHAGSWGVLNPQKGRQVGLGPIPSRPSMLMNRSRWEKTRRIPIRLLSYVLSQLKFAWQILKARTWQESFTTDSLNT